MQKREHGILLVLTDVHLRNVLGARFEKEGWRVQFADGIEDGERRAVKFRPEIFLVEFAEAHDVHKHTKHWRSLPTLLKAKIIVLLPNPERKHVDDALKHGADQVILKGSVTLTDLMKTLQKSVSEYYV